MVQVAPFGKHPDHETLVAGAAGVAVRVIAVELAKPALQMLGQLIPPGELVTVPVPETVTVRVGFPVPPPPVPVKQTTFAVILPVTTAPEELRPPLLEFVLTVAEMTLPPHTNPVAVSNPVGLIVNICASFEPHET